jgi:hypothetical protein
MQHAHEYNLKLPFVRINKGAKRITLRKSYKYKKSYNIPNIQESITRIWSSVRRILKNRHND